MAKKSATLPPLSDLSAAVNRVMPQIDQAAAALGGGGGGQGPAGARMQAWYIDSRGREVKTGHPVPVTADNRRTEHERHTCPAGDCPQVQWLLAGERRFCAVHGKELAAPTKTRLPRGGGLLVQAVKLHGVSAAPWLVLVAAAAALAYLRLGGDQATAALAAVLLVVGARVGSRWWWRRDAIKANDLDKGQRTGRRATAINARANRAALAAVGALASVIVLAPLDPASHVTAALTAAALAGWALWAYPWWVAADRRRAAAHQAPPAPLVAPAPPEGNDLAATVTRLWATLIGGPDKPLAGTYLTDVKKLPGVKAGGDRRRPDNWTATVLPTVRGSINMREVRPSLVGRIAAAVGCSPADVAFYADEQDVSKAYVRVRPDNPLAEVRMWGGPAATDWARGISRIGRFDDGTEIPYLWWSRIGGQHDLISGCSGSGKSELVCQLLLASLHSGGRVIDWVCDPQGGQSYGALREAVDWFASTRDEIKFLLLAATAEMFRRNDVLAARRQKTWHPDDPTMPLLVLTLDEFQTYVTDPAVCELVERLAEMGRKCGIKIRIITQVPAVYSLGDSSIIKEAVRMQGFVFRAVTDAAGRAAVDSDSPVDPTAIPATWGAGTCAPGDTTAGMLFVVGHLNRDIPGRADWTGDSMDVWLEDEFGAPNLSPGTLPAEVAELTPFDVLYGGRIIRAGRALGRGPGDLMANDKAYELIEHAGHLTAGTTPTDADGPLPAPAPIGSARDRVLAAVHEAAGPDGRITKAELVKATAGMNPSTREKAINALIEAGDLERVANGVYTVAAPVAAA